MKTEASEWLYGPGVVAWLDERGLKVVAERHSARARMALHRWKREGAANYYALDNILTELTAVANPNICASALLDELPEELFCEQPNYHPKETSG